MLLSGDWVPLDPRKKLDFIKMVTENGHNFRYGSDDFKKDPVIAGIAFKSCGLAVVHAPKTILDMEDLAEIAEKSDPRSYKYFSVRVRSLEHLILLAVAGSPDMGEHIPKEVMEYNLVEKILRINPMTFKYLPLEFRNSRKVLDLIVYKETSLVKYSPMHVDDVELAFDCVKINSANIAHFGVIPKSDIKIAEYLADIRSEHITYMLESSFSSTKVMDFVFDAMKVDISKFPRKVRSSVKYARLAMMKDPDLYKELLPPASLDETIIYEALKHDPSIIFHMDGVGEYKMMKYKLFSALISLMPSPNLSFNGWSYSGTVFVGNVVRERTFMMKHLCYSLCGNQDSLLYDASVLLPTIFELTCSTACLAYKELRDDHWFEDLTINRYRMYIPEQESITGYHNLSKSEDSLTRFTSTVGSFNPAECSEVFLEYVLAHAREFGRRHTPPRRPATSGEVPKKKSIVQKLQQLFSSN